MFLEEKMLCGGLLLCNIKEIGILGGAGVRFLLMGVR